MTFMIPAGRGGIITSGSSLSHPSVRFFLFLLPPDLLRLLFALWIAYLADRDSLSQQVILDLFARDSLLTINAGRCCKRAVTSQNSVNTSLGF